MTEKVRSQSRTMKQTDRARASGVFRGPIVGQTSIHFVHSAKRMLSRMRPESRRVVALVMFASVSASLSAVGPRILGRATNILFAGIFGKRFPVGSSKTEVIESLRASGEVSTVDMIAAMDGFVPGRGVDFEALSQVFVLVCSIYIGASLLSWLQGYMVNEVVQRTIFRMRAEVETKLNRLPLSYFDRQPRGELLSRVTNDIDNVSQSLGQTLSQSLSAVFTIAGVVVMMLSISISLTLISFVTIPVGILLARAVMKRSQVLFVNQWKETGVLSALVEESFTGHELIKVFGRRRDVEKRFEEANDSLYRSSFGAQFLSGLLMPMMMFMGNVSYLVIAVVGGLRVASGSMSLGNVQAFISYSAQFTQPLTQVAAMANLLQSGVASAERVFELLDAENETMALQRSPEPSEKRGRVEFERVSFCYDKAKPLISDLSFVVTPGQSVAIVGPTGAGKTTIVNLIMRFYEVDEGQITLDNVDIGEIARSDLRAQIGMVLQDTWLFEGTIRENIAYGRPEATDGQIRQAAEATFVDRFVHSLPDGYNTIVSEGGENLSAGERQLVTIARACLIDPALLILDEATSSVDTRTEVLLQKAMAALRAHRTSFVIAHRLSTIRQSHLILVMNSGEIVEHGNHEELLLANGPYAAMYTSQFKEESVTVN